MNLTQAYVTAIGRLVGVVYLQEVSSLGMFCDEICALDYVHLSLKCRVSSYCEESY